MNRCRRCGRGLTNPVHAQAGIGPICAKKAALELENSHDGEYPDIFLDVVTDDIVIQRLADGRVGTNVPHRWDAHGKGFEFGYGGSGPADLALNILLKVGLDRVDAYSLHQDFKWKYIAPLSQETGGTLPLTEVLAWIAQNERERFEATELFMEEA